MYQLIFVQSKTTSNSTKYRVPVATGKTLSEPLIYWLVIMEYLELYLTK